MSRLHAKTNQIGKLLNNLDKYNRLMKDGENMRSPTTPNDSKSMFSKTSPTSPKESSIAKIPERRLSNQSNEKRKSICQSSEEQTSDKKSNEEVAGGSESKS